MVRVYGMVTVSRQLGGAVKLRNRIGTDLISIAFSDFSCVRNHTKMHTLDLQL